MKPGIRRRVALLTGLVAFGSGVGAGPVLALSARPVELPAPELALSVSAIELPLARPPIDLPSPPPAAVPTLDAGGPPLPRFQTEVRRPEPPLPEVGTLACTLAAFRRAQSLFECGLLRLGEGNLREARQRLEEARERGDPLVAAAAAVWLGELGFREGRPDLAQREYRPVLDRSAASDLVLQAALGTGWAALLRGDLAEAQRGLARARALAVAPGVALLTGYLEGVLALLAGQPAEALALFEALEASGPSPVLAGELSFWRGVAQVRLGQLDAARQGLERFLGSVSPGHGLRPDALAQAGWTALARGAADEAVRQLLEVNPAARPDLAPSRHAALARAYLALGDLVRARDEALRLADRSREPLAPPTLLLVADEAARRRLDQEAEPLYRRLLGRELPPALGEYAIYRLGELYERQGRLPEAQRQYVSLRDAGRIEPLAQRAAYRLGLMALQAQNVAGARHEAEAVLRAGVVPELREVVLLLAAEAAGRGQDPNRAVRLFRLLLQEFPTSPHAGAARLRLGWALLDDGEPELALREWREAARAPDLAVAAQAYLAMAMVALRHRREGEALEAYRGFAGVAPTHPAADTVALARGVLLVRARAWGDAVQELEPLVPRLARTPQEPVLRRALGIARYQLQQYDLAERQFRQVVHVLPAEPSNWLGVGLAAFQQSRLAEAEDALGRARTTAAPELSVAAAYAWVLVATKRRDVVGFRERATEFVDRFPAHPHTASLLYALLDEALQRQDLDQARRWAGRLATGHPQSDLVPSAFLALAQGARDHPAIAREAYRELSERLGDREARAEARLGLAEVTLRVAAPAEAQAILEALLGELPASHRLAPQAWALLIRTYEVQGQAARVLEAARTFLDRFPQHPLTPAVQLTRGHRLLGEGRFEEAQQALEVARDGGEAETAAAAHVWLGELHRARQDHELAVEAYLGATYVYPDSPWAARGLQGAAQSYLSLGRAREVAILLRKLAARPGVDPALARWAREALQRVGPVTGEDPAQALRRGARRPAP